MNTQNETYDHQSFDHHPTAPMFPAGWDLSTLPSAPKTEIATEEAEDSAESE